MKKLKTIAFIYTLLMSGILANIIWSYKNTAIATGSISSYSDMELKVYKQIWETVNFGVDQYRDQTFKYQLIMWGTMLITGYLLLFVIYNIELKPIIELQDFAAEIAKGNLDVPLPMRRYNSFVEFTESFDIMREELKASKQREIEADNAKRQLMAELSHDLKTPVATIRATCEVLQMQIAMAKKKEEGTVSEYIKGLEEKIGYITNKAEVINELMQTVLHAAIDDLKEVTIKPVEAESMVIEDLFMSLTEYGKIVLDDHIPECLVYMDKLRMEQVIDNIVGNSYKYAGTDIHVSFDETDDIPGPDGKNQRFIKVIIRDEGPGVPEDDLPMIVEKYYRGGNSKEKSGYGLGMYLVNLYMERQGGGMEYYNDKGFVVELMVRKV
ncbi:MAG: HAMP domain-containing histidine kinase [Lachnospiraceae bacterium]|nr:HAMP domain-containing histidine kinase [Lachnospiraceae bacterium]